MLIAEARVATDRAGRYLVQLCRHVEQVARAHPQMRAHTEWSDERGTISLGPARCTLRADPGVLTLRAEAPDEASLNQVQQRVAGRLEQIGRRDRLTVTWTPPHGASDQLPPPPDQGQGEDTHMSDPPHRRDTGMRYEHEPRPGLPRWVKVAAIVVAVLVLLVVIAMLVGGGGGHGPGRHF